MIQQRRPHHRHRNRLSKLTSILDPVQDRQQMDGELFDVIIIGTGAGGGTLAYALSNSGLRILILERGGILPKEDENCSPAHVFGEKYRNGSWKTRPRYKTTETWIHKYENDRGEKPTEPGMHYYVGGNTKLFGAALVRLRKEDFGEFHLQDGTLSPAWPIAYCDLEPYYCLAEKLYRVHGQAGEDPTDPPRSTAFPGLPIPHDPQVAELAEKLRRMTPSDIALAGKPLVGTAFVGKTLTPAHLPIGVDWDTFQRLVPGDFLDGFPCKAAAKSDVETCALEPALKDPNLRLIRNATVDRFVTNVQGTRITWVEAEVDGHRQRFQGRVVVVSSGAVNSAALLLRSNLANSSDCVGRYYMAHLNTTLIAVNPFRKRRSGFQKTLSLNDFYLRSPHGEYPLGNVQLIGKLRKEMLLLAKPYMPKFLLDMLAKRSIDWWVLSEDAPLKENRVELVQRQGKEKIRIHVSWTNREAHQELVGLLANAMRKAGYPLIFTKEWDTERIENCSHQVGTARFGRDPKTSVLDPYCRSHDVQNLFVVDGSFFPSSGAVNPALTIMAQALRVGDWMTQHWNLLAASDSVREVHHT